MRMFLLVAFALGSIALATWPDRAQATDARQAVKLCDNNPNCNYRVNDNGSVDLNVKNCGGGSETCFINCPQKGQCTCDVCGSPARVGGGKGKDGVRGSVAGMLKFSRSTGQSTNPTRPPSGGLLEGGAGFATQGPAAAGAPARSTAPASAPAGQLR